jgi:farnesyl-diphosphate farnesyltransferase
MCWRPPAPDVAEQIQLANDMGLFLQKTNIIRDYLEDFVDKRAFWPKEIWGEYASNLGDFAHTNSRKVRGCV